MAIISPKGQSDTLKATELLERLDMLEQDFQSVSEQLDVIVKMARERNEIPSEEPESN